MTQAQIKSCYKRKVNWTCVEAMLYKTRGAGGKEEGMDILKGSCSEGGGWWVVGNSEITVCIININAMRIQLEGSLRST